MTENYKKLSQPPVWALRKIAAGKLQGKTDINPQWRYEAMNEVYGECGIGWKQTIDKVWTEHGGEGEVLAFAQVSVYIKDSNGNWSEPIIGVGGSKLVQLEKGTLRSNDEGFKMATTDALSVALKFLGVAADIYKGCWDGNKYVTVEPSTIDENEYNLLKNGIIDYINIGTLTGDVANRANDAIAKRDIVRMRNVMEWCKSHSA